MSVKNSKQNNGSDSKRHKNRKVSHPKKSSKRVRSKPAGSKRTRSKRRRITKSHTIKFFSILSVIFLIYLYYLDSQIKQRFEGRIWQLPAHVYARPLEIYSGKSISSEQLLYELEYLNYKRVSGLPNKQAQFRQLDDVFEIKTRDFTFWDGDEAGHSVRLRIKNNKIKELNDIYTNTKVDLVRFDAGYLTGIFPAHSQDRVLVKLDDVPDMFIKILLLVEDRRFFSHWGVDPKSIARAFAVNLMSGDAVQGGSTLTQQLVKNLFLYQQKSLVRKINEAFMSLLLEFHHDKKLILETYINEIYLGQDGKRAIHGFGLASEYYFGHPLKDLSIDQMATLVGIVKGASYYNPKRNPEHARDRRDIVLNSMLSANLITQRQSEKLQKKPVTTVKHARSGTFPAFVDAVKEHLKKDYQSDDLQSEGLRIFTTLDPYIQFKTEQAVKDTIKRISTSSKLQAAAVVVSPLNGDLLSVVGDRNPSYKGFNRALNAKRPIGSLIKPVVYLTALEQSETYTLATILDDSPLDVSVPHHQNWRPKNFDKKYHGEVTLYEALLKSYNIPAARTGIKIGIDNVINTMKALGYGHRVDAYPSLTLGATPMSPMDVASIYQSFSANGFHHPLRSVHAVLDKNGNPLERYSLDVDNQVKTDAVTIINSALIDVTKYGTARKLSTDLALQVAGKTGTSDDLRDSWFAGFSGDVVAVVWTGYDDNSPTNLTGSSGAMKIWQSIISKVAYESYKLPEMPQIRRDWIDMKSGYLTREDCENAVQLMFIEGTQPKQLSECATAKSSNWFLNLFN